MRLFLFKKVDESGEIANEGRQAAAYQYVIPLYTHYHLVVKNVRCHCGHRLSDPLSTFHCGLYI